MKRNSLRCVSAVVSGKQAGFCGLELLESRIAPAYVATLTGVAATLTGDGAGDTLIIKAVNGLLQHNRFSSGDPGFVSDLDWDSATAGVQTLAADPGSSVAIGLGTGLDTVVLGGDQHAAALQATFNITNTGADGDVIEVNDALGKAGLNLAVANTLAEIIVLGGPINVHVTGDVLGKMIVRTGSGADTISVQGAVAGLVVLETGAGNDMTVSSGNGSPQQIDGGPGADLLNGGNMADVIHGGPGNDTLIGRQGSDLLFGDDGLDNFIWNPGDASDTIDGGTGTDLLTFNGSNIAENMALFASGRHFIFTRNVANIFMDSVGVEQFELGALAGADNISVADLSATDLRAVRLNLASPLAPVDGALDTVTFTGSDRNDDLRLLSTASGVRVTGLGPTVDVGAFEITDQITLNGGLGLDNVFSSGDALGKLGVSLIGETFSNSPLPVNFAVPGSYDAGTAPTAIAAGNLFGKSGVVSNDLVVVDSKLNAIEILTNNGNGTFLPAVQLSTGGKTPRSVALADFNNDNQLDIVVTNSGSGNVSIFLNQGDGTFSGPTLFAIGKTPGVVRVGDVTGDGKLDVVALTSGNTFTVLDGVGDGTFNAPTKRATGGTAPTDLVLTDFSGDGRLDVAVANGGSNNVTLLRANPDFSFAAPLKTRVGLTPSALAVGDFDGDGHADLAVTHAVSRFVSVLLNTASTSTTAAFNSPIRLSHPGKNGPLAVAVADLNEDGRDDIVVGNSAAGTVSVFQNAGGAAFRPALTFDLDNEPPRKIAGLVLADFNDDGHLDIAAANAGTADVSVITRLTS